jgi:hypothetical protein
MSISSRTYSSGMESWQIKVESVGTTQADVKELAEAIDKEMLSHLGG